MGDVALTGGNNDDRRPMARRDQADIDADKLAERRVARRGAGYEGQRQIEDIEIDDPFDYSVAGKRRKTTAAHNAADDWHRTFKTLNQAQRQAGDIFRASYEAAGYGRGQGQDFSRERVDISGYRDNEQVSKIDGMAFLNRVAGVLGQTGNDLLARICGRGETLDDVTRAYGYGRRTRAKSYLGMRLREALTDLAAHLHLAAK